MNLNKDHPAPAPSLASARQSRQSRQSLPRPRKPRTATPLVKKVASNRISKLSSSTNCQPSRRRPPPVKIVTRSFDNVELFNCAVRIFTRLPILSGLAGPSPRLCGQNRDKLEINLEYPTVGLWKALSTIRATTRNHIPRMTPHNIRQLRDTILNDLSLLVDSQIPFDPDVSSLFVAGKSASRDARRKNAMRTDPSWYAPLLDTFDLNKCTGQEGIEINWAQHKKDLIHKVQAQFNVLEVSVHYITLHYLTLPEMND